MRSKKKIVEKLWDILGKNFLGSGGFTLDNCKKCQTRKNEYHTDHLTGLEKEKDIFVRNIINKLANED